MLPDVKIGDSVLHPQVFVFGDHAWRRRYGVVAVDKSLRFGKEDLLLQVNIFTVDTITGDARQTDCNKAMWLSQVAQAL